MTLPDLADLDTYGGVLQNYGEVADPSTDLDASAFNECRADVAALGMTGARALRRFIGHATTPTDPTTGFVHRAMWGDTALVKPTPTHSSTGVYLVGWPETVTDALGTSRTVNFAVAHAWVELTGSTRYTAHARVTAANEVEVRVFDNSGALSDAVGLAICVVAW